MRHGLAHPFFIFNSDFFEAIPAVRCIFYSAALHKRMPLPSGLGQLVVIHVIKKRTSS